MADRAHIRHDGTNWQKLKVFNGERGRIKLDSGDQVSPVQIGFTQGVDKVVDVIKETNDTSTGSDVVRTTVETIEGGLPGIFSAQNDRLLRTVTIRDMTAQEITDRGANNLNGNYARVDQDPVLNAMRNVMFRDHNSIRVLEGKRAWTKVEFNDWFKARIQDALDNA